MPFYSDIMPKIIKISAHDCPICAALAEDDIKIAETEQMPMEVVELDDLAQQQGTDLYNYVVGYHLGGDGSVIVPIYVIMDDHKIQASSEVKEPGELFGLISGWRQWKAQQPD